MTRSSLLDASLRYAGLGYRVLPLVPGTKQPLTGRGHLDASLDPDAVRAWWEQFPTANIGISTAGFVVIDVDGADNPWPGPEDPSRAIDLDSMPRCVTPRGGTHYYARPPDGLDLRNSTGKLARKVDTRADGGYIVAPPSVVNGRPYCWIDERSLNVPPGKLPVTPGWLVEALTRSATRSSRSGRLSKIPAGQRNTELTSIAGRLRRQGLGEADLRRALEGINAQRCVPPLEIEELAAIARSVASYPPESAGARPRVVLGTDEYRVADEVIARLAEAPNLYRRGDRLVRVEDNGGARVSVLVPPNLRELITLATDLVQVGPDGSLSPAHPPDWLVSAIFSRREWSGVSDLRAISCEPFLRADGTVCCKPGYDPVSNVLLLGGGECDPAPIGTRRIDAEAAVERLCALVGDFPFARPEARSGWLALVLTLAGRFAFNGPAPLFLIDANVRSAGKSLLAQVASMIALGRPTPASSYVDSDNELRKQITAHLIAGDRFVVLDNINGLFGSPSLDRLLTCESWGDRLLGASKIITVPATAVWAATGNNTPLRGDTPRRVIPIRLEVLDPRPEERSGFRLPQLLAHVAAERSSLLRDALTVLAGYFAVGRPAVQYAPLGGFEGWSATVRAALVWAGQPDPCRGRFEQVEVSDCDSEALGVLLAQLQDFDLANRGFTAAQLLDFVTTSGDRPALRRDLNASLQSLVGRSPTLRQVGVALRGVRSRIINGRRLETCGKTSTGTRWRVA